MGSSEKDPYALKLEKAIVEFKDSSLATFINNITTGNYSDSYDKNKDEEELPKKEYIVSMCAAIEEQLKGTDNEYLQKKVQVMASRSISKLAGEDNFLIWVKNYPNEERSEEFTRDLHNIREIYERLVNNYDPDSTEQELQIKKNNSTQKFLIDRG